MAKQKNGLHKQVDEIFDGAQISSKGQVDAENKASTNVSGNVAVAPANQDSGSGSLSKRPAVDNPFRKNGVKPADKGNSDFNVAPVQRPKTASHKKAAMLPASLAPKQKSTVVDKLKAKMEAYAEENGKKQLYMVIAMPFLAIIMVVALYNTLFPSKPEEVVELDSAGGVTASAQADIHSLWPDLQDYPSDLRDPMRAASMAVVADAQFRVNGIVFMEDDPSQSVALVGNVNMHIGDDYNGAKIKDIQRDYVEFEVNGKKIKQGVGKKY